MATAPAVDVRLAAGGDLRRAGPHGRGRRRLVDYGLNGDIAHVALLDAIGHGLEAAVMATVAVAAMRNARRRALELSEVAEPSRRHRQPLRPGEVRDRHHRRARHHERPLAVDDLRAPSGAARTRRSRPARARRGDRTAAGPRPAGGGAPIAEVQLEPGDRILLYTDGVVEARDHRGEFFTPERLAEFVDREESRDQPIAETLRQLNLAILAHQEGLLQDDATTVMVEWLGPQDEASTPPTSTQGPIELEVRRSR